MAWWRWLLFVVMGGGAVYSVATLCVYFNDRTDQCYNPSPDNGLEFRSTVFGLGVVVFVLSCMASIMWTFFAGAVPFPVRNGVAALTRF
jgi:hypothetical protein